MHYSLSFLAIATSAFLVSSTYASSEPIESVASGPSMSSHSLTSTGSFTHHPMPMGTGEAHENHWTKKPLGTWIDKPIGTGVYKEGEHTNFAFATGLTHRCNGPDPTGTGGMNDSYKIHPTGEAKGSEGAKTETMGTTFSRVALSTGMPSVRL